MRTKSDTIDLVFVRVQSVWPLEGCGRANSSLKFNNTLTMQNQLYIDSQWAEGSVTHAFDSPLQWKDPSLVVTLVVLDIDVS